METKSTDMEAVEIKTEPLDDDFNQIIREEVIIKSEPEMDYTPDIREPEVQISEDWLEPKEEPSPTNDSVEDEEAEEFFTPANHSTNEDRLREDSNTDEISNHCKFCNMFFKSRTALKLHERNCQYKNDCRLCGQRFVTAYALNTHLQRIHNRVMENNSPLKEKTKNTMGRPLQKHNTNSETQCDICHLKFANSRGLNNHKKKHNTCQQCGEICKTSEELKKHTCDNVVVKEEDQSEPETPTKKIFRATNSMVVIPGEEVQTPSKSKAKVKTAKPKKRKSRALFQENSNDSSSDDKRRKVSVDNNFQQNSSPKSGFSVVTKDTDFEAFAQQMMKGFTDISEPLDKPPEIESVSDQILRKLQISSNKESKHLKSEQQGDDLKEDINGEAKVPQPANVIVDSEGNVFEILKENFITQPTIIKEEPLDEDEKLVKPQMPIPLPLIKDEANDDSESSNQPDATDNTDLLLEELFDRKAKSIAKVRQTKLPFNPSFEPNDLESNVKKEFKDCEDSKASSTSHPSSSSPPKRKKRKYTFKNRGSVQNVVIKSQPISIEVPHVSRRKALPHKLKDDILENLTPVVEKNNRSWSSKKSRKVSLKYVPPKPLPPKKCLKKLLSSNLIDFNALNGKLPDIKNSNLEETFADEMKTEGSSTISLFDSAGETPYSSEYNCISKNTEDMHVDDNACSGDEAALVVDEDRVSVKMEDRSSTTNELTGDISCKGEDSSQQPSCGFEVPSSGEFDFEEVIQSNKLPNFNNVKNVIKNLTEEYKKAEKVKLEKPPALAEAEGDAESQTKPKVPEAAEGPNKPSSLFFPMLDDTQVYNMVANALNEKYRYVWICPVCPRQYSQMRPFKKHLLTIHFRNVSELEGQAFELRPELVLDAGPNETFCHLCHVTLADNATLRKHQLEMHKDQDLTLRQKKKPMLHRCYICSKLCSSRTLLAEHMKSDCGKNPQYGCNVCDKKFHTKSTLNLHKTMHTGELPHSCEFCQKRFRTRGQLTVHTRTHTGEKPFPCKVCGQCFTHRETLIAHLSRHIDMKRYKCYGCDQFFSCISGLKTHRSVRPETCGRVELNARAVGPRVRVIKGNVIFEPQPIYNARLAKAEKPTMESYILDHNYYKKDTINQAKKASKQMKNETIIIDQ